MNRQQCLMFLEAPFNFYEFYNIFVYFTKHAAVLTFYKLKLFFRMMHEPARVLGDFDAAGIVHHGGYKCMFMTCGVISR